MSTFFFFIFPFYFCLHLGFLGGFFSCLHNNFFSHFCYAAYWTVSRKKLYHTSTRKFLRDKGAGNLLHILLFHPEFNPEITELVCVCMSVWWHCYLWIWEHHKRNLFCTTGCLFNGFYAAQSPHHMISTQILLTESRITPCLTAGDFCFLWKLIQMQLKGWTCLIRQCSCCSVSHVLRSLWKCRILE